jgi:four helix bundle protein
MPALQFDHARLKAYQEAVRFTAWVDPILEPVPGRLPAKDQLDRASTSIALNIAEGNGKRSHADRCRFLDIARGSALECAACLDVLVARRKISAGAAAEGKDVLLGVVSLVAGLIARFDGNLHEPAPVYGSGLVENENDYEKENEP